MSITVVDLLRHGELEGGVRYRGNIEAGLTRAGRERMDAVWRRLRGKVEVIVTSPLHRCVGPAHDWAEITGVPCRIEPRIREMHYGAWEGLNKEEIEREFPGLLSRWRENPVGMQIPGAENLEHFARRVVAGWESIIHENEGRHVLAVAHSGSLRIILAHVLGAPLSSVRRLIVPYTSWSRVICQDGRPALDFLNHLS